MDVKKLLNKGLKAGYAGGIVRKGVKREGFSLESSHLEINGGKYHDEWLAGRVGGGQELVKNNGDTFTRVYAGGTIADKRLELLGITGRDVIGFLKTQMTENSEYIRLFDNFTPKPEGDWQYKYEIIDKEDGIPIITGKESIFYKKELVFTHILILCPVEV